MPAPEDAVDPGPSHVPGAPSTGEGGPGTTRTAWALRALMMALGLVWGIDGIEKIRPGFSDGLPAMMAHAATNQPSFLHGWFNFWALQVTANPQFFTALVGTLEFALFGALVLGFLRKIAYLGSIGLGLMVWSTAEGMGSITASGAMDVGAGIIYALLGATLLVADAAVGRPPAVVDAWLAARWRGWPRLADVRKPLPLGATGPDAGPQRAPGS